MDPTIRDPIRNYVIEKLLGGDPRGFEDDTDLFKTGVLRSLATLELTSFLEKTFSVRLKPAQINPGNFKSVSALCALVAELKASGAASPGAR